jgi:folate-binding protein YgfZ
VRDEHTAVRSAVGFWPLPDVGVLRARGADRLSWTNGMVSNDIRSVPDGGAMSAGILTAKGRFVALVDVWREPDEVLVLVEGGRAQAAHRTLDSLLVMEDVELADASAELAVVSVQGPAAQEALPDGMRSREKDRSGSGGFDLLVPRADLERVLAELGKRFVPVGAEAAEILRIEAGIRRWGHEVDENVFPQEARLEETLVSFTKGCFVGQETVVRLRDRGHANRLVVGLDLEDAAPPDSGAAIRFGDADVGHVTSAARSLSLGKTVAMGFVKRAEAQPGASLSVGGGKAVVVELPFVSRIAS